MNNTRIRIIGERIKAERTREGCAVTLDTLADKIGVTRQTISKWEKGEGSGPTVWDLIRLCEFFGCDYGYLIGDYECRTRVATDITEETGLSELAVIQLQKAKGDANISALLNAILESPLSELQKLAQAYHSYTYAKKVIVPVFEENKDKITGKRVYVDFVINDKKSPSRVGIQEIGDYTEFNLLRSFLKVLEAKEK